LFRSAIAIAVLAIGGKILADTSSTATRLAPNKLW
jgi:hypothetical protein